MYKTVRLSETKHTEEEVHKILMSLHNVVSPFNVDDGDALFCLSSAMPAPPAVEKDLPDSEKLGLSLSQLCPTTTSGQLCHRTMTPAL